MNIERLTRLDGLFAVAVCRIVDGRRQVPRHWVNTDELPQAWSIGPWWESVLDRALSLYDMLGGRLIAIAGDFDLFIIRCEQIVVVAAMPTAHPVADLLLAAVQDLANQPQEPNP